VSPTVALAWFAFLLWRETLPPLLPTLVDSLSIDGSEVGLLLSVTLATYALSQYPGDRLADQLTRKTVIVTGLVVAVVEFIAIATMCPSAVLSSPSAQRVAAAASSLPRITDSFCTSSSDGAGRHSVFRS